MHRIDDDLANRLASTRIKSREHAIRLHEQLDPHTDGR